MEGGLEASVVLEEYRSLAAETVETTIDLPHMNLIIFPPQHALPHGSSTINHLWFSTVQLALLYHLC